MSTKPTTKKQDEEALQGRHQKRIVRCTGAGCDAPIVWLTTAFGKRIPADAQGVKPEDEVFIWTGHKCHFETCADPNRWQRRLP